jgi:hypothetical protein
MSYLYVVNSQKPTAVNYSVTCSFTSSNDKSLIIAKSNQLEFHVFRDDGLHLLETITVFGRIASLQTFRPTGNTLDALFVLTDKKKFCILEYNENEQKIITKTVGNLKDRKGKDADVGQRAFLDPDGRVIGLQLYDSSIKVNFSLFSLEKI